MTDQISIEIEDYALIRIVQLILRDVKNRKPLPVTVDLKGRFLRAAAERAPYLKWVNNFKYRVNKKLFAEKLASFEAAIQQQKLKEQSL